LIDLIFLLGLLFQRLRKCSIALVVLIWNEFHNSFFHQQ